MLNVGQNDIPFHEIHVHVKSKNLSGRKLSMYMIAIIHIP